ncbi:unnamed protein product [Linum trigynum]|uniref:Uncharacterized protein n=1 Tax=Linum trigynum TaxID=586398 RepID=A0AAV2CG06_9ROSI
MASRLSSSGGGATRVDCDVVVGDTDDRKGARWRDIKIFSAFLYRNGNFNLRRWCGDSIGSYDGPTASCNCNIQGCHHSIDEFDG